MATTDNASAPIRFRKNHIIYDRLTSESYRILYMPTSGTEPGYWINVNSATNVPRAFNIPDVQEKLAMNLMAIVADTATDIPSDEELSPAAVAHRDKAWNLIQNIITKEPDIYINSQRTQLLKNVETVSGVKANNLYNYLGKYWRNGFRTNALAPKYKNCGGARIVGDGKKIGRPKRAGNNGKTLNQTDYERFQDAIDNYYLKGRESLHKTYEDMLARSYIQPRISEDERPITLGPDEKPSFGQFYYWYHNIRNASEEKLAREGESKHNLEYRAVTGHTKTSLPGPGFSYQIDATIGDFYLVKEAEREKLIGRPIIVLVIDAWTDMVVGMSITLENSSSHVWKEALLNAFTSKVSFCKQYGINITEEDWPCKVKPISITTDNGEFAIAALDDVVRKMNIILENCPPYRGDLKGLIERALGKYQFTLKPYVPGYVEKDAGQRGAKDYRKDSCFDFRSFVEMFIRIILFYNNSHYMKTYLRTNDLRQCGIPSIPRNLWNYGISHKTGTLKVASLDECYDVLLQQGTATITEAGIRHNYLYYTCKEAVDGKWMEKARIDGTYEIPIRFSASSCKHIYIKGIDGKYITCDLVNDYSEYENISAEEVSELHEADLNMEAAYTQQENQAYAELIDAIDKTVDHCKSTKESGSIIIKSLKAHGINKNREEEKRELSGENAARKAQAEMGLDVTGKGTTSSANNKGSQASASADRPKSFDSVSRDIDRILSQLEEE